MLEKGKKIEFMPQSSNKKLIFGTSTASDGPMGTSSITDEHILKNIHSYVSRMCKSVDPKKTITAQQVHGNKIEIVSEKNAGSCMPQCDGLITNSSNLALLIRTQDCVPIFLRDDDLEVAGILHAGWRNILSGILPRALSEIENHFDTSPKNISVTLGPSIKKCCFEIQGDVFDQFNGRYSNCIFYRDGKTFLDLGKILWIQAITSGVFSGNINEDHECTCCFQENNYWKYNSWRREHKKSFNLGSVIVLSQE